MHTFRSNVSQLDSSRSDEFKRLVDVLGLLYAHPWVPVIAPQ